MVMLKKRKMVQYLIHHLPRIIGRKNSNSYKIDNLIAQMQYLYSKLGIYDRIIDHIRKVGI